MLPRPSDFRSELKQGGDHYYMMLLLIWFVFPFVKIQVLLIKISHSDCRLVIDGKIKGWSLILFVLVKYCNIEYLFRKLF